MACPLCRARAAKRFCPALRQEICPVCCGQKRFVEIACPDDCTYLASSRTHPAAAVKRQQEDDLRVMVPAMDGLTGFEREMLLFLVSAIGHHKPDALHPIIDADVADAMGALAATLETEGRGVI